MAAECLTTLTEQWIRDRLQLTHPCLGDVRSLSLPGTSEQRIAHLGSALNNFVRLRSLDLSYNALISIEGLQHLKRLEHLTLYHNLIPSLEEVKVLFGLSALKELDLRLNPLTKSFPHYRPCLIHAMPNLRKLDNCSVRDTERKASLMQFSSDMFYSKKKSPPIPSESHRKTDQMLGLAARLATTDSNDAVLNFVETNPADHLGNFSNSVHTEAKEFKGFHMKQNTKRKSSTSSLKVADRPKVSFGPHVENHPPVPGSLKHSRRAARGYFTPNPDQSLHHSSLINIRPPSPRNPNVILSDPSNSILHPPRLTYSSFNKTEQSSSLPQQAERKRRGGYRKPLEMLLDLVDKHWTGEQLWPHNNNFLSQAVQILSMMESDITSREAEVKTLRQEVEVLSSRAASQEVEHKTEVGNLSAQLEDARQAVGELNKQLQAVLEENVALQKQLIDLERQSLRSLMISSPSAQIREAQREVEELRKEIQGLKCKVLEAEDVR
ncbi:centrosomal protein of 72 kDa isoform X2 [Gouania willdenowi]|nr:centrosomal protein of 72 kDa isoform X2 [Gouania willdenowi]